MCFLLYSSKYRTLALRWRGKTTAIKEECDPSHSPISEKGSEEKQNQTKQQTNPTKNPKQLSLIHKQERGGRHFPSPLVQYLSNYKITQGEGRALCHISQKCAGLRELTNTNTSLNQGKTQEATPTTAAKEFKSSISFQSKWRACLEFNYILVWKKKDVGIEEKLPFYGSMIWDHSPMRPLIKVC